MIRWVVDAQRQLVERKQSVVLYVRGV